MCNICWKLDSSTYARQVMKRLLLIVGRKVDTRTAANETFMVIRLYQNLVIETSSSFLRIKFTKVTLSAKEIVFRFAYLIHLRLLARPVPLCAAESTLSILKMYISTGPD